MSALLSALYAIAVYLGRMALRVRPRHLVTLTQAVRDLWRAPLYDLRAQVPAAMRILGVGVALTPTLTDDAIHARIDAYLTPERIGLIADAVEDLRRIGWIDSRFDRDIPFDDRPIFHRIVHGVRGLLDVQGLFRSR